MNSPIPIDDMRRVFSDVLETPLEEIRPDSNPDTVENWDSINHLNLVMAIEQEFGMELEPEEIEEMLSVEQTLKLLNAKLSPSASNNGASR